MMTGVGGGDGGGGGDYWSREICISRLNASVITVNSTTSNGAYARSVLPQFIRAGLFACVNLSRHIANADSL